MTKINDNTLTKESIDKMIKSISKTIRSKTEHGFSLCIDEKNKIIKPGKECVGEEKCIDTKFFKCKKGEKHVGIFHSHLKDSVPSMSDLNVGYMTGMNCIGSYQEIMCYKRKKEEFDALEWADIRVVGSLEDFTKFQHAMLLDKKISEKEYRENWVRLVKERHRIIDSYFNIIKVR